MNQQGEKKKIPGLSYIIEIWHNQEGAHPEGVLVSKVFQPAGKKLEHEETASGSGQGSCASGTSILCVQILAGNGRWGRKSWKEPAYRSRSSSTTWEQPCIAGKRQEKHGSLVCSRRCGPTARHAGVADPFGMREGAPRGSEFRAFDFSFVV